MSNYYSTIWSNNNEDESNLRIAGDLASIAEIQTETSIRISTDVVFSTDIKTYIDTEISIRISTAIADLL